MTVLVVGGAESGIYGDLAKRWFVRGALLVSDALIVAQEFQPSVIAIDVKVVPMYRRKWEALEDLRAACGRAKQVVFSASYCEKSAHEAMSHGAFAYCGGCDLVDLRAVFLAARSFVDDVLVAPSLAIH